MPDAPHPGDSELRLAHCESRIAALIAVDAPPASYLTNGTVASGAGLTAEDVPDVMLAVAPVVGTARVVSASGSIPKSLGFMVAAAESGPADEDAPCRFQQLLVPAAAVWLAAPGPRPRAFSER